MGGELPYPGGHETLNKILGGNPLPPFSMAWHSKDKPSSNGPTLLSTKTHWITGSLNDRLHLAQCAGAGHNPCDPTTSSPFPTAHYPATFHHSHIQAPPRSRSTYTLSLARSVSNQGTLVCTNYTDGLAPLPVSRYSPIGTRWRSNMRCMARWPNLRPTNALGVGSMRRREPPLRSSSPQISVSTSSNHPWEGTEGTQSDWRIFH